MTKYFFIWWFLVPFIGYSQGKNHNWLLGYTSGIDTNVISKRAWLKFDSATVTITPDNFKMPMWETQGNISSENGDLLFYSNGCWIANATGDTMLNGSGLNPGPFTSNFCSNISGLPWPHGNIVLPFPNDSTKYILFHLTGNFSINNWKASELYYSVIDMTLGGGLGGVVSGQKNLIAINDTLVPGMAACRHANGRDWWIIAFEDSTSNVYKILLTPQGIVSVAKQTLSVPVHYYNMGQVQFSPDGKKFAYHYRDFNNGGFPVTHQIRLFDFDRCSGLFSNASIISYIDSATSGYGLAFSSNSQYLYFTTYLKIFQMNTDSSNVQASLQVVAINDTFYSPTFPYLTDFWLMYLAANGKIFISSGNSVIDIHYINNPDSSGTSCDVQQHALHLPCYHVRTNVYHPNYYLGCDTTLGCPCLNNVGIKENQEHDFKFSISPNPTNGSIKIIYMLPQNNSESSEGVFEMFDINGKKVFSYHLPKWSTLQNFYLSKVNNGIYNCVITSSGYRTAKKLIVVHE